LLLPPILPSSHLDLIISRSKHVDSCRRYRRFRWIQRRLVVRRRKETGAGSLSGSASPPRRPSTSLASNVSHPSRASNPTQHQHDHQTLNPKSGGDRLLARARRGARKELCVSSTFPAIRLVITGLTSLPRTFLLHGRPGTSYCGPALNDWHNALLMRSTVSALNTLHQLPQMMSVPSSPLFFLLFLRSRLASRLTTLAHLFTVRTSALERSSSCPTSMRSSTSPSPPPLPRRLEGSPTTRP
jgi:hypothetical protein